MIAIVGAQTLDKWIKIDKFGELPSHHDEVLVVCGVTGKVETAVFYDLDGQHCWRYINFIPTYWMPLPRAPINVDEITLSNDEINALWDIALVQNSFTIRGHERSFEKMANEYMNGQSWYGSANIINQMKSEDIPCYRKLQIMKAGRSIAVFAIMGSDQRKLKRRVDIYGEVDEEA